MGNRARESHESPPVQEERVLPVGPHAPRQPVGWRHTLPGGMLRAARPKQWLKNALVLAAPAAAGVLGEAAVLGKVALALVAFTLASSGTYYLNDVADLESDRRHPLKRHRPIAFGIVPVRIAVGTGLALLIAALLVAYAVRPAFLGVVVLYLILTTTYSLWLKHVPVADIGVVTSGFVIRAVAGGVAVDVPISRWFLIVASFGSLFVVVGKRRGEQALPDPANARTRLTLASYSHGYIHSVWTMAAAVTVTAYCLWAFEQAEGTTFPWFELTIIPFVLAILRYALLLEAGEAGAPEDVFLRDPAIRVLGVAWMVAFGLAIYVGT